MYLILTQNSNAYDHIINEITKLKESFQEHCHRQIQDRNTQFGPEEFNKGNSHNNWSRDISHLHAILCFDNKSSRTVP